MDENSSASEFKVNVPLLLKFPATVTEPVFWTVKLYPELTVMFCACNENDINIVNSINFLIIYYLSEANCLTNSFNSSISSCWLANLLSCSLRISISDCCSFNALISTGTKPW